MSSIAFSSAHTLTTLFNRFNRTILIVQLIVSDCENVRQRTARGTFVNCESDRRL